MEIKKITPQEFFKIRKLSHQSPHLATIDLPFTYNLEKVIDKWISQNLKHRYYLSKTIGLTQANKIDNVIRVGFEDKKELSDFILACPYLKYN
jgi:hypothetical protein